MDKRLRSKLIKLQTCLEDAVLLLKKMTAEIEELPSEELPSLPDSDRQKSTQHDGEEVL